MTRPPKKSSKAKKSKGGRPTKITKIDFKQVEKLAEYGLTNEQIAKAVGIADSTLRKWSKENPAFSAALKKGKDISDAQVEQALFKRAIGYSHEEKVFFSHQGKVIQTKTVRKQYPPDVVACIFWLKNRRHDRWRDKVDHLHSGELDLNHHKDEVKTELLKAAKKIKKFKEVPHGPNPGDDKETAT